MSVKIKFYWLYTRELKDNLEKHPGEKINNNNFTYHRYGISLMVLVLIYKSRCKKYKDRMNENIWYYAYADDKNKLKNLKKIINRKLYYCKCSYKLKNLLTIINNINSVLSIKSNIIFLSSS